MKPSADDLDCMAERAAMFVLLWTFGTLAAGLWVSLWAALAWGLFFPIAAALTMSYTEARRLRRSMDAHPASGSRLPAPPLDDADGGRRGD